MSEFEVDEIREQFTQVSSTNEKCISIRTVAHTRSYVDSQFKKGIHFDLAPRVKELVGNIINKMQAAKYYRSMIPLQRVSKAIPKKLLEDINVAMEST